MEQYLVPACATVVVAIIEALAARERNQVKRDRSAAEKLAAKERASREEREKAQEKLLYLLVESTGAAIALGEATGHAMQRGHTNGDMEAALAYATDVKHKQKEFLAQQGIHAMLE